MLRKELTDVGGAFVITYPLLLAVAVWFYILYFRAELPKKSTLEWISMYDRPAFRLTDARAPFSWHDVIWCLLPAVAALCLTLVSELSYYGAVNGLMIGALDGGLAAVTSAALYLLLKSMTGSLPAALLGTGLVSVNCFCQNGNLLPAAVIALFLWLWATGEGCGAGDWIFSGLAALCTGGSLLFGGDNVLLIVPLAACVVFVQAYRLRHKACSFVRALLMTVYMVVLLVLAMVGAMAVYAVQAGLVLSTALTDGSFVQFVLRAASDVFRGLAPLGSDIAKQHVVDAVYMLPAHILLMIAAFPVLITAYIRRREPMALLILAWTVTAAYLFFLGHAEYMSLAAACCSGYVTARLLARKRTLPALLGGCVPLAMTLLVAVGFLLPYFE